MKKVLLIILLYFFTTLGAHAEFSFTFEWGDIKKCTSGKPNRVENPIFNWSVFMEGLSTGLMPFGTIIGDNLPKKASMIVVLVIIGILGVGVTFAEPAIGALQAFGSSIDVNKAPYLFEILNNWTLPLVLMVGAGVGLAAIIGTISALMFPRKR